VIISRDLIATPLVRRNVCRTCPADSPLKCLESGPADKRTDSSTDSSTDTLTADSGHNRGQSARLKAT
jgi:hypothetical protein